MYNIWHVQADIHNILPVWNMWQTLETAPAVREESDKMPSDKLRAAAEPRHTGMRTAVHFRAMTNRT